MQYPSPRPLSSPARRGTANRLASALSAAALSLLLGGYGSNGATLNAPLAQLPGGWRDDNGAAFQFDRLIGHPVILTMAYAACHRICPMTIMRLREMQAVLDQRGEIAEFIVIGYDPDREGPSEWHAYRREHGLMRPNWHFLTGSHAATEVLAQKLEFEFWTYDEHVMHQSRAIVFDPRGAQRATLDAGTRSWSSVL